MNISLTNTHLLKYFANVKITLHIKYKNGVTFTCKFKFFFLVRITDEGKLTFDNLATSKIRVVSYFY